MDEPLPFTPAEQAEYAALLEELKSLEGETKTLKDEIHRVTLDNIHVTSAISNRRHARKMAVEAEAARREEAEARLQMRRRLDACRFDDWRPHPEEPLAFVLPEVWAPFRFGGLAYTNVVPLTPTPPEQRYDMFQKRWETVGPALPTLRQLFLLGASSQESLCHGITLGPNEMPGTPTGDLVCFLANEREVVIFIDNPLRRERIGGKFGSRPIDEPDWKFEIDKEEFTKKFKELSPFLRLMRNRFKNGGADSSVWT